MILFILLGCQFDMRQIYYIQSKTITVFLITFRIYQFIRSAKFRIFFHQSIVQKANMYNRFCLRIVLPVI